MALDRYGVCYPAKVSPSEPDVFCSSLAGHALSKLAFVIGIPLGSPFTGGSLR